MTTATMTTVTRTPKKGVELVLGSEDWAIKSRKKAKELAHDVDHNYMKLARVLYEIYSTPIEGGLAIYQSWGYTSFSEYVSAELDMQPKSADRLKRIWYRLEVSLHLSEDLKARIVALGRTKVRELIRVIDDKNAAEWIEHAEICSHTELSRKIAKYIDDLEDARERARDKGEDPEKALASIEEPGEDPEELLTESFKLYPEQARNVDTAVRRAKDLSGSSKRGHNLDLICTHFLGTNDFGLDKNKNQKRLLSDLEKSLQLKLIALDPKSLSILYGKKHLEELAQQEE